MKIIDEKGRLFGKINLIDFLLIISFLFIFLPVLSFGYRISKIRPSPTPIDNREQWQPKEFSLIVDCKFVKLNSKVLNLIAVGDKEFDSNGKLIGEIISLGEKSNYAYAYNLGPNYRILKEEPGLYQIPVTLKITPTIKGLRNLYYNNMQLSFSGSLDFSTSKYSVEAENLLASSNVYSSDKEEIIQRLEQNVNYAFSNIYGLLEKLIDALQSKQIIKVLNIPMSYPKPPK
jgi:hypothetical protein